MKEFEITLAVTTVAHIKTKAYNRNDAMDTAYHMLANELVQAANDTVTLSDTEAGRILSVKTLKDQFS